MIMAVSAFKASREIPAAVEHVFAAFRDPERLARWWGPAGFTNTFNTCEFKAGGRWSFTMHGPDGKNYRNESVFTEIEAPNRILLHHITGPTYHLTITLAPSPTGTLVSWLQEFENPDVGKRLEDMIRPANEQNLDRLAAEVLREMADNG
jgi:uncharacterized protein YndB with AHSA1/START domain